MIVECINCNKKFEINSDLIPADGRLLQCGSCNHKWFFRFSEEKNLSKDIIINETIDAKTLSEPINIESGYHSETKIDNLNDININKKKDIRKKLNIQKFLSYFIVIIVTLIALIIVIDTFESILIEFFPYIEIFLYNLFESLKDIKLFIIDLF